MADEEGPQAPVAQGAHDPPAPQDPLPPQDPQNPHPLKPFFTICSSSTRNATHTSTTHTTIKLVPF